MGTGRACGLRRDGGIGAHPARRGGAEAISGPSRSEVIESQARGTAAPGRRCSLRNIRSAMEHPMTAITGSTALWYASRATGVVSLLLLTLVVMLGILVNRQGRLPGLPSFAVTGLHRSLSLLAVAVHRGARGHRDHRPVREHRAGGGGDPVRLGLRAVLARPGRGVARPDRRAHPDQPGCGRASPGGPGGASTGWPTPPGRWRSRTASGPAPTCAAAGCGLLAVGCALAVAAAGLWRLAATARRGAAGRAGRGHAAAPGLQRQARQARAGRRRGPMTHSATLPLPAQASAPPRMAGSRRAAAGTTAHGPAGQAAPVGCPG